MCNKIYDKFSSFCQWKLFWSFVVLTAVLLNGCSTLSKHDGPPSFYVDAKKVPNAVPKIEPLSRIGNKPYYTVFGHRYGVLKSSYHYNEVGVASWYGTMFHARRTSNGERYNMLAMTAAHKTLPLPTYVEVTNLKNHQKIIVKINDRGPFEGNRLIDLSYVAAKKLGMLGHGTTLVRVKSIDPRDALMHPELMARHRTASRVQLASRHHITVPHYSLRQHTKTITTTYVHRTHDKTHRLALHNTVNDVEAHTITYAKTDVYIQVGAFRDPQYARRLKRRLLSYTTSPIKIHASKRGYHVQIGPIKDMATATRISQRLKTKGIHIQKMGRQNNHVIDSFDMT